MKSPISTPDVSQPTPQSAETIAIATDQALYGVITILIKKGLIDAEELAGILQETSGELSSSSTTSLGKGMEMLNASLAVGRLTSEILNMAQKS